MVTLIPSATFLPFCHVTCHVHSSGDRGRDLLGVVLLARAGQGFPLHEKPRENITTCTRPRESGLNLTNAAVPVLSPLYFSFEMLRFVGLAFIACHFLAEMHCNCLMKQLSGSRGVCAEVKGTLFLLLFPCGHRVSLCQYQELSVVFPASHRELGPTFPIRLSLCSARPSWLWETFSSSS